ncbi:MAG TPA: OmpA family protein [Gemmatimonadaceae bacterium]|jgi:peptidoglycan-associated lipoprotein|nr:OmpA family protein [Gemmatimonadaceae bacterium]
MKPTFKQMLALTLIAPVMGACVHPGQYKKDLAETRGEIQQEKTERIAGDDANKADIASVKGDVQSLRSDLDAMRTEFNAKITALEEGIKFDVPVNFAFDDATVRDQDKAALDRFAAISQKYYGGAKITIEGFADPAGSKQYNLALSTRRADAVRDYLSSKGIEMGALKTVGYGKTRLVNPNASKDDPGAEQNRRVVFVIETKPEGGAPTASADAPTTPGQQ